MKKSDKLALATAWAAAIFSSIESVSDEKDDRNKSNKTPNPIPGVAKLSDIQSGKTLYYVNGFVLSENIIPVYVTKHFAYKKEPFGDRFELFEWFEGVEIHKGNIRSKYSEEHHFSDLGIDTPLQKADHRFKEGYPLARNYFFATRWFAVQYIKLLKHTYPECYGLKKAVAKTELPTSVIAAFNHATSQPDMSEELAKHFGVTLPKARKKRSFDGDKFVSHNEKHYFVKRDKPIIE